MCEFKNTVRYCLMDEEPWTIETEINSTVSIAHKFTVFIESGKKVGDLRHKLAKMTCTGVNLQFP